MVVSPSQAQNHQAAESSAEQPADVDLKHSESHDDSHCTVVKNDSHDLDDLADIQFDDDGPNDAASRDLRNDPEVARQRELIASSVPSTDLEVALRAELDRQVARNEVLAAECIKLRGFVAKRKQTYKRKRKDESAPRKKLSGYNLFVRERFARLARENENTLKNSDSVAELKRVPPASNIASSGHAWSLLSAEEKARYNEMAKPDEDRYEKESSTYVAPEKISRKRNRTGYNVFFSQYVLELKQNDGGVPPERGSVARVVGDAWKSMSAQEKDTYERQAEKQNELDPVDPAPQPPQLEAPPPPPPPPQMALPLLPPEHHHQHHHPMEEPPPPMEDGGGTPQMHPDAMGHHPPGMPPPHGYPPEYAVHGPPPPVIHQPPGYEGYYGVPPPYDPYAYPPPPYPGMPPPPPPVGAGDMPPYGPPPPNYQVPYQTF